MIMEGFANGKCFINVVGGAWTVSGEMGFQVCDPLDTAGLGVESQPSIAAALASAFTTKLR